MTQYKLAIWGTVGLVVALGVGYAWGASGKFAVQSTLDETLLQRDLSDARGHLLDARVSLYNNNFGAASTHFEAAKSPLRRVRERYQNVGKNAAAGRITAALEHLEEGQRLTGKLDSAANNKANDALEAIRVAISQ
jgi:hypothetical protein